MSGDGNVCQSDQVSTLFYFLLWYESNHMPFLLLNLFLFSRAYSVGSSLPRVPPLCISDAFGFICCFFDIEEWFLHIFCKILLVCHH